VGIIVYALAVVGGLTVASCLALGMGLAIGARRRSREESRSVLPPPDGTDRPARGGFSGRWN
jgi:hypothetical protein